MNVLRATNDDDTIEIDRHLREMKVTCSLATRL
jgi:hypothetical protein